MKTMKIMWPGVVLAILAVLLASFLLALASVQKAEGHRPVGQDFALRSANRFVRDHFCGRSRGWKCTRVSVPLVNSLNRHYYTFHGTSFSECRTFLGVCYKRRQRGASGRVNGHTGQTVVYKVW